MKTRFIIYLFIGLCLTITSCSKRSDNDEILKEERVAIVKELSKMYPARTAEQFNKLKGFESGVFRTQNELVALFSLEQLSWYEELQNIDFNKYSLLLGRGGYGNQVSNMEYSFSRLNSTQYKLQLKVAGLATQPDVFFYGVIVNKLPRNATVSFDVSEIQLK